MSDRPTGFYWVLPRKRRTGQEPQWQVAGYWKLDEKDLKGEWYTVGDDDARSDNDFETITERVERTRRWLGTFRRLDTGESLTVETDAPGWESARALLIEAWRHGMHLPPDLLPPWQLNMEIVEEHGA